MFNKISIISIVVAAIIPGSVFAQSATTTPTQTTTPQTQSTTPQTLPLTTINPSSASSPNNTLLPDNFNVYTNGTAVINHPAAGFNQVALPTNNDYKDNPGCYVACYSRDKASGVYTVGNNIYVNGQVRVAGSYKGRICTPTGYETKDISQEDSFHVLCAKISTCTNNQCWAGGDTGGWFGIQ